MFLLMVVNNWFVFTAAFMAVTGTRLAAVFSLSFFIITNLIVLNVLMSLILDLSSSVREEMNGTDGADSISRRGSEASEGQLDAPRKVRTNDYMHMIRNVLLRQDEDDGTGSSPLTGLSSGGLT